MVPVEQGANARWLRACRLAAAWLSGACVVLVAGVGTADGARGAVLGITLSGLVALGCGTAVIGVSWWRRHGGAGTERARLLLGVAVTVWGTGQFLLGLEMTADGRRTFGLGDSVSSLAGPVLLLAFAGMPRRSRVWRPSLWLALNAAILAAPATLAVWWLLLQPALADPAHPAGFAVSGAGMALFDTGIAALSTLVWARDRRRGSAAVAVGLVLQAIADISSMSDVVGDRPLSWVSGALWCIALPLLTAGIIEYGVAPVTQGAETVLEDLGDSRAATISAVLALGVVSLTLALPVAHRWSPVSLVLYVATVALMLLRETANSIARVRMIRWLGREALHDVLTGLPNRSALTERIRRLDLRRPWVLMTVDLDNFKEVNDLLGTEAGDEILVLVGKVLSDWAPLECTVARIGGDEFAVLARGDIQDGGRLARQALTEIRAALRERSSEVALSVSIGVGRVLAADAADPVDGAGGAGGAGGTDGAAERETSQAAPSGEHRDRFTGLLESAAAVRAAKEAGRDRVALYAGEVERARRRRLLLERRLRTAVESGTLEMHAQPLVDLHSGRIAGFESLARWTDEELGPVSPAEFVPVAEETGLVTALGEFALRRTLAQARAGGLVGMDVEIGVNVSPIQLRHRNFAPMVIDVVGEFGLDPQQLLLEVTEAILVDEDDPASAALALLADAGIQLAIDDFGTGYSALGYLRRLPVDVLKIDRSWVVASVNDGRTRDIVGGVVSLAHTLGAIVVMEGIEDDESAQMCRELEADLGQGWLFGRPRPWPLAAADLVPPGAPAVDPLAPHPAGERGAGRPVVPVQRRPAAEAAGPGLALS